MKSFQNNECLRPNSPICNIQVMPNPKQKNIELNHVPVESIANKMIQLEQKELETLIRCQSCQQIYNLPIILPCGVSICQTCFQKSVEQSHDCNFCSKRHEKNANYPINHSVKMLLNMYSNALNSKATSNATYSNNIDSDKRFESIYSTVKHITRVNLYSSPDELASDETKPALGPVKKQIIVNNAKEEYQKSKQNIEDKIAKVKGQVDNTVELIISGVANQKNKLYKEIDNVRNELLAALNEQYENMNLEKNNMFPISETKEDNLVGMKLNKLNKNVIDSLLSDTELNNRANNKNDKIQINDIMAKMRNLNNPKVAKHRNLTALVDYENIVKKRFGLMSGEKMAVIIERYFGQVSFLYLYLVDADYTILASNQVNGIWGFHSYCISDKNIVIALRLRKEAYKIILYNERLELLKETTFNYRLKRIFMNPNEIILTTHEKKLKMAQHFAHVFNYELVEVSHFGQTKQQKKSSWIPGTVLTISPDKIYTKLLDEIVIIPRSTMKREKSFKTSMNEESIMLDYKENRLVVFRSPNELEMYNPDGVPLFKNQFLHQDDLEFDEFYLNETNICLVNNKKNHLVIV